MHGLTVYCGIPKHLAKPSSIHFRRTSMNTTTKSVWKTLFPAIFAGIKVPSMLALYECLTFAGLGPYKQNLHLKMRSIKTYLMHKCLLFVFRISSHPTPGKLIKTDIGIHAWSHLWWNGGTGQWWCPIESSTPAIAVWLCNVGQAPPKQHSTPFQWRTKQRTLDHCWPVPGLCFFLWNYFEEMDTMCSPPNIKLYSIWFWFFLYHRIWIWLSGYYLGHDINRMNHI